MAILNPRDLKSRAQSQLRSTPTDCRKLILVYTGTVILLNLIVNGLQLMLDEQISSTGGLGGLGIRSVLQTIQTVLGYLTNLFTPFWQAGFLGCIIGIARNKQVSPRGLFAGVRRLPRILSYFLLQALLTVLVLTLATYSASFIFSVTPFAAPLAEVLVPLVEDGSLYAADGSINLHLIPTEVITSAAIPLLVIIAILAVPALVCFAYQFRMSLYLLLEGPPISAIGAMALSARMMQGHKWKMLKLDLSFWWYYLLDLVLVVVCYLDIILPMLGIGLPVNSTVAFFATLILYSVLLMMLHLWKKTEVDLTYVLAYESIYMPPFEYKLQVD